MERVIDYSVLNSEEVSIFNLNNVSSVVLTENDEYRNSLRNYFTDEVKNARFFPSVKAGNWDGKIRHLMNDGTLPSGLLDELFELLRDWDIPYKTYNNDSKPNLDLSSFESIIKSELIDKQETPMNPWEHQIDIAKTLLSDYRGLAKSATSSGKTYTMAMICKFLQYTGESNKTLIIVPRTDLVVQFSRDALSYGFDDSDIGMFFGVIKDSDKPITIATWQSIQNIEKNDPFFEQFECVIADECFVGDSLVSTEKGHRMIKDLKCGDIILSYNESNDKLEYKPITKIYENRTKSKKLIKITLENGKVIKCTPNHLLKTENRGWITAIELKDTDLLVQGYGDYL